MSAVAVLGAVPSAQAPSPAAALATPKPARINRAIQMLEHGQPVYHAVLKATRDAGSFFLNTCNDQDEEGVMICTGG